MSKKTVGSKYEYELASRLGAGAFAEVYKGKNKQTGETVAIKVIKRSLLSKYGDDILKQIHQEVSILQQLVLAMRKNVCPFINKIFECLETTNNIYIVLEFCNQGTLLDKIKKQRKLPEEEAIFIFFQLISALEFLADNNIAHRDIKPENVFIKDGIFKLGDFGFAGQKSLYQTHLGTYPYMAPEFFNSNSYDGNQVDIWALGLLFHEILFGEIYYIGNSQYEVSQKILNKQYTLGTNYQCSKEIRDLLPRMIEKDKAKRITAKQVLLLPIFLKYKADSRYVQIMDNERKYMAQLDGDNTNQQNQQDVQKELEEKLKKEEIEKQKAQQELLAKQKEFQEKISQGKSQIIDIIQEMRNGVLVLVKLCEFLQKNFSEVCRFDVFYILKQSFKELHSLKEKLDSAKVMTVDDHVKFAFIETMVWEYFYQDSTTYQLLTDIEYDRNVIRKSYIDQMNYLNNFTNQYYQEYVGDLQKIADMNIEFGIPKDLYITQLNSTMNFMKSELKKELPEQIKNLLTKAILWIYISAFPSELVAGRKLNVDRFLLIIEGDDVNTIKEFISH